MSHPNREQFVALIEAIDRVRQRDNKLSEAFTELFQHHTVVCSNDKFVDAVCTFLESLFGDCGHIHAFVYEFECGRTGQKKESYCKDASELYNRLTKK